MLQSLEFANFKSWAGRHRLELGRLTGLFGANSTGKSSITSLLLLLKQTIESPDPRVVLHFGGNKETTTGYVDLGSFRDIITDHDLSNPLALSLDWTPPFEKYAFHEYVAGNVVLSSIFTAIPQDRGEEVVVSNLSYKAGVLDYRDSIDSQGAGNSDGGQSDLLEVETTRDSRGQYKATVAFKKNSVFDSVTVSKPFGFHRFDPYSIGHMVGELLEHEEFVKDSPAQVKMPTGTFRSSVITVLDEIVEQAEFRAAQLFEDIVYLGPLRSHPNRNYIWTGTAPTTVGHRGEQAIQVLLANDPAMVDAVSKWMRKLGIASSLSLEPVGEGARIWEALIEQQDGATRVNFADVGFGVSQVLPVIVALLSAQPGSLVILEHPEIHLHPRIQSELADLLIDIADAGEIQILVESHSEHLLARIQRRIAEAGRNGEGLTPEDVRLYFCELEQGRSKLTPLEMQPSGVITNWPPDFFGDMLADRMALSGFYPEPEDLIADR